MNNSFVMSDLTHIDKQPVKLMRLMHRIGLLLGASLVCLLTSIAGAQSIWDGGGADTNWTTPGNWQGNNAPVSSPALDIQFAGSTGLTPTADVSFDIDTITFNNGASSFVVGGPSTLTIFGSITNADDSDQEIDNGIIFGDDVLLTTTSTGDLTFGNAFNNAGFDMTMTAAAATTISIDGLIIGTGGITINGPGDVVLGGANTYSGGTTIAGGSVEIGTATGFGTGSVSVTGDATVVLAETFTNIDTGAFVPVANNFSITVGDTLTIDVNNVNNTMSGVISGAGALSFFSSTGVNAPILTLSGVNTYTGGTTIGNGVAGNLARVVISSDSGLGAAAGALTLDVGQLRASSSFTMTRGIVVDGGGSIMTDGGDTLTLNGVISGVSAGGIGFGGATIDLGSGDVTQHDGTVVLGGVNTFTTDIVISYGTLQIASDSNLGNAANDIFFNGSSDVGENTTTTLSITGNTTIGAGRDLDIAQTADDTAVVSVSSGRTATIAGIIFGTADGTFQKTGAGTLILTGVNIYTGATTVSEGTLQISGAGTIGVDTDLTVTTGATFDQNGIATSVGSISGGGSILLGAADMTTGASGLDTDFSGVISGAGGLIQDGAGTQTLSGANTYTGTTTITTGAISAENDDALGDAAAGTTVAAGAELQLQGGVTIGAEALQISGDGVAGGGALRNVVDDNTYGGDITLAADSTIGSNADTLTITGNIGGAFELTITGSGDIDISGIIGTGANDLVMDGTGTLTLTGLNTFTGDVVINSGTVSVDTILNTGVPSALGQGNLILGSAGADGMLSYTGATTSTDRTITLAGGGTGIGTVEVTTAGETLTLSGAIDTNGNTFRFAGAGNLQVDGVISNTGGVTMDGTGTLIFNNTMTYTGDTTINSGTLQLAASDLIDDNGNVIVNSPGTFDMTDQVDTIGSLAGSGTVVMDDGGLTAGGNNSSTEFSGTMTGTVNAFLNKDGTGTLTLSGNSSSFSGAVGVVDGVVLVTNSGGLGNTTGLSETLGGATLAFAGGVTTAEPIGLRGDGFGGVGALQSVSGNNQLTGPIFLFADSRVNSDADTLTLTGGITGNFDLTFGGAGDIVESGVIATGANTLTYDGTGMLTLSGLNTFTGQVDIQNGIVAANTIADGGVASSLGAGAAGTPILLGSAGGTGILAYTGGATSTDRTFFVNGAGGGRIQNLGGALTLNGAIDNNGDPFAIGGTGNTTVNGVLSGAGTLTKDGSGTLTMGAVAHTYSGATALNEGAMELITGSTVANSDFTVASGASLLADSSINGLINNGRVTVGSAAAVGTLNVGGNYSGTGTLSLRASGAAAYDVLAVTGTATLTGGTLQPGLLGGFIPAIGSTIAGVVTAGGGLGGTEFDRVRHAGPVLAAIPTYNPGSVDLTFQRDMANPELGLNSGQLGLGLALQDLDQTSPSADLTEVLDAITRLPDAAAVKNAYDQILPTKLDQMSQASFTSARMQDGNLTTRMNNLRAGVTPRSVGFVQSDEAARWNYEGLLLAENGNTFGVLRNIDRLQYDEDTSKRWGVFANGSGVFGQQDARTNQTAFDFTAVGATIGADYRFSDNFVGGLAGGYSHIKTSVDNNGGEAVVQSASVGPYVSYKHESIYFDGTFGYSRNFYDIERNIAFGTIDRTATGKPDGNQVYAYGGVGYDYKIKDFVIGPVGTMQYTSVWMDGYTETGAGILNLNIQDQHAQSLQSGIGWHWAYVYQDGDISFIPNLMITWQHEYLNDSRLIEASLAGSSSFQTPTASPRRDTANVNLGLNTRFSDWVTLTLGYNTILGDNSYTEHAVNGGVRFDF